MNIREGQPRDVPTLVALDSAAYGSYGADEGYFRQKFQSPEARIIVSETNGAVTGFIVFEVMEPDQPLEGFTDLKIAKPITETWMHIIAFTTASNFKDVHADSELLRAAEKEAGSLGCTLFCVPLSINHPYMNNGVFGFWEKNGYQNAGIIKWMASATEIIDCYFYTKPAGNTF